MPASPTTPTSLEPEDAAKTLIGSLPDPRSPHTVADAAAASGLALRDAERGLTWLTQEYRGHLRVTDGGDLLYLFPFGFTQPWKTHDALARAGAAVSRAAVGALRFIVRAWLMIVLLAYVAIFLAILIGMTFASQNSRDDRRGSSGGLSGVGFVLLRVLGDALFWTFHPFSPFAVGYGGYGSYGSSGSMNGGVRSRSPGAAEVPFYEKVNRFFFGPTPPKPDPLAEERAILAELRAQKGRIGLADVMKVTGLTRAEADPLMARLMLDYDGDVAVSEDGGIVYHFEAMRKTAEEAVSIKPRPKPAWENPPSLPPLTGNPGEADVLIAALNLFNLIMSGVAIANNITLAKLPYLILRHIPLARLPYDGTPLVLGVVPLAFSAALFLLPLGRAALRPLRAREVAREKGRLGILREVLTRIAAKKEVTDAALEQAWARATGTPAPPGEVSKRVAELGADVRVEGTTGAVRYRFADLETEALALEAEREAAADDEKKVGRVIFASDE
jgi:hypothetical protein